MPSIFTYHPPSCLFQLASPPPYYLWAWDSWLTGSKWSFEVAPMPLWLWVSCQSQTFDDQRIRCQAYCSNAGVPTPGKGCSHPWSCFDYCCGAHLVDFDPRGFVPALTLKLASSARWVGACQLDGATHSSYRAENSRTLSHCQSLKTLTVFARCDSYSLNSKAKRTSFPIST